MKSWLDISLEGYLPQTHLQFLFDNVKTKIIQIRKIAISIYTNYKPSIDEEKFQKFQKGRAEVVYVLEFNP